MSIAFSIAHAAHRPERKAGFQRLLGQLDGESVVISDEPGPPREWSERQWLAGLSAKERYVCCLNDDIVLCPDFIGTLWKVIEAQPGHIIDLRQSDDMAALADGEGKRWITSVDGLVGQAYVIPSDALRAFLDWRASALVPGAVDALSEDQLINLWAMEQGALIWHCVPALVSHDNSVPSCYGNERDAERHPRVPPREGMADLDWATDALHAGLHFRGNFYSLLTKLKQPHTVARLNRYFDIAGGRA